MNKYRFLIAIFMIFFISCNSSADKNSQENMQNDSQNDSQKILKVAVDPTYPPFGFTKNGSEVVGFDIDILKEVSKIANFKYITQVMNFDAIIPALKTGKIDMAIASMLATPERKKSVSFSDAYYKGVTSFLKRKDDKIDISNMPDSLHNKKVSVYIGTLQDIYVSKLAAKDPSIIVIRSSDPFGAMMNLKSKKADIFIVNKETAKGYLKTNKDLVSFYDMKDDADGMAMAFNLNTHKDLIEKINAALKEIRKNGIYDKLLKKYDLE